jgi:hypothetical protein
MVENLTTTQIKKIDELITVQLSELGSLTSSLQFDELGEFVLSEDTSKICSKDHSYPGVYFFEIKNMHASDNVASWMQEFEATWKHIDYHMQWVPGIKKHRVKQHTSIGEWVPLYIGKSRNVGARVNEHILKELSKTTFAMKLKARKNLYGTTFRVKALKIDIKNYDVIVPYFESCLRDIMHPIVGKQ